ncbi:MAG: DUF952 domain-containing protein [Dehalococcoidia bacterium]
MAIIFHLVPRPDWEEARSAAEYQAASLAEEGFIHCSQDHDQLLRVAQRLYAGRTDLAVLEVETDLLAAPLKREPSRSGEIYPHIYGTINTDAVVRWWPLPADGAGNFFVPES